MRFLYSRGFFTSLLVFMVWLTLPVCTPDGAAETEFRSWLTKRKLTHRSAVTHCARQYKLAHSIPPFPHPRTVQVAPRSLTTICRHLRSGNAQGNSRLMFQNDRPFPRNSGTSRFQPDNRDNSGCDAGYCQCWGAVVILRGSVPRWTFSAAEGFLPKSD